MRILAKEKGLPKLRWTFWLKSKGLGLEVKDWMYFLFHLNVSIEFIEKNILNLY
jgi:hypothetical protein